MAKRLIVMLPVLLAAVARADTVISEYEFTGTTPGASVTFSATNRFASGYFHSGVLADGSEGIIASWSSQITYPDAGRVIYCSVTGEFPLSAVSVTGSTMAVHFSKVPNCTLCPINQPGSCSPTSLVGPYFFSGTFTMVAPGVPYSYREYVDGRTSRTIISNCVLNDGSLHVCTESIETTGELTTSSSVFSGTIGPIAVEPPTEGANGGWNVQKGRSTSIVTSDP